MSHLSFDRITELSFVEAFRKDAILKRKKYLVAQAKKAEAQYEKEISAAGVFSKSCKFLALRNQAHEINAQWLDFLLDYENLIVCDRSETEKYRINFSRLKHLVISQESEIIELKKTTAKLKIELMKSLINSVNIASRK